MTLSKGETEKVKRQKGMFKIAGPAGGGGARL